MFLFSSQYFAFQFQEEEEEEELVVSDTIFIPRENNGKFNKRDLMNVECCKQTYTIVRFSFRTLKTR